MTGCVEDDLWSAGLRRTSSNTSPKSHSTTPATSRPSTASTKMRSELPLKAAHQNFSMADCRSMPQPNIHYRWRRELYWYNCAPVIAVTLVSTWTESTRQHTTIVTAVHIRLMTPTTLAFALRGRPHWQWNRYGRRRPKPRNTSTWRLMRRANNNNGLLPDNRIKFSSVNSRRLNCDCELQIRPTSWTLLNNVDLHSHKTLALWPIGKNSYRGRRYVTSYDLTNNSPLSTTFLPWTPRLLLEHIGRLVWMSVSGCRGRRFEPRQQYVVCLSKILYLHCFSRLRCEMSTRWGQPRDGCSVLWAFRRNST